MKRKFWLGWEVEKTKMCCKIYTESNKLNNKCLTALLRVDVHKCTGKLGSSIRQIRTQIKFARPIANLISDTSRTRAISVITTAAVQRIQQFKTSASGGKFGEEKWNRGLVNSHALKGRGRGGMWNHFMSYLVQLWTDTAGCFLLCSGLIHC